MAKDKGQDRVQAILRMLEKQDQKKASKPKKKKAPAKKSNGTKSTMGKSIQNIKKHKQRLKNI